MTGGSDRGRTTERAPADSLSERAYWAKFAVIYVAGVFAAASIGKIGPIAGVLRTELGLSLGQVGLIASSVTATSAVVGLVIGVAIRHYVKKPLLLGGLVIMAVAGLAGSQASSFVPLLAARLVESVGFVIVVVTAPVLVMSLGNGVRQTAALALWGTFHPVGLALGTFAGGLLATVWDAHTWLAAAAGSLAVIAVLAWFAAPRGEAGPTPQRRRRATVDLRLVRRFARPLSLAAGFATASATIVAMVAMLPTYLTEVHDVPAAQAGTLTGAVSLVGVAGGLTTSWLSRRGVALRHVFAVGVFMPVGMLIAFTHLGGVSLSLTGAVVVSLANEMVVAAVFAAVPLVAPSGEDVSAANGLIAQFGSIGALGGPPLAGLIVLHGGGWWAIGPATLVMCAAGILLLRRSVRPAAS